MRYQNDEYDSHMNPKKKSLNKLFKEVFVKELTKRLGVSTQSLYKLVKLYSS